MDKLKNILSPGHATDDEKLYGTGGTAAPTQPHGNPSTASTIDPTNELHGTAADAKAMPGSINIPGGFVSTPQEESTRGLGYSGSNEPSTTSTAYSPSANPTAKHSTTGYPQTSQATTSHGSPVPSSTTAASFAPAGDTASAASIKSGVSGNPPLHSSTSPTGTAVAGGTSVPPHTTSASAHTTSTLSSREPSGVQASGIGGVPTTTSTTAGSSEGRIQDPSFSNRNLQRPHEGGTSTGASPAAAANPLTNPVSGTTGRASQPATSGITGTSSHPTSTTSSHPITGNTGAMSVLSDRSRPHADVGETVVERSFPLGGHAGEGPHSLTTANRLNPAVPDSAAEYRQGTHQHHDHHTGTGVPTAGTGIAAGVLAGERAHQRHGHHGQDHHYSTQPASTSVPGISGTTKSTTSPTMTSGGVGQPAGHTYNTLPGGTPSGVSSRDPAHSSVLPSQSTSTAGTHGLGHAPRDTALGVGATAVGAGAAYEAGKHSGTGHSTEPTRTTMTSGGVGQPSGHQYNVLSDGTPSGIAASDPAHPEHSTHVPTSTSTRVGPSTTTGHGSSGHTVGRDLGAGASGAGATGLAAHEYQKHRGQPSSGQGVERAVEDRSAGAAYNHRPVPGYEGPQALLGEHGVGPSTTSTAAMRAQESLSRYPEQTSTQHGHAGRDAAAVGGVGTAGTAAYEADKHRHDHQTHGPSTTTTAKGLDTTSKHHGHAGHDATAATGSTAAGTTAAYEADKHHHGKENHPTSSQPTKDREYVQRHPELAPGHPGHSSRDAAVGAGAGGAGAGGAGAAGAYEAEKHKHGEGLSKHDSKHEGKSSEEKKPGLLDKILHPSKSKEEKHEREEEKKAGHSVGAAGEPAVDSRHIDTAHGSIPTKTENITQGDRYNDPYHSKDRTPEMRGSGVHGTEPVGTHHSATRATQPGAYEGAQVAAQRHGYDGPSATQQHIGRDANPTSTKSIDPRVDNPQYGGSQATSHLQEDPATFGESPSSGTSGEKHGTLSNLLHRENPNKLHKDPPTY